MTGKTLLQLGRVSNLPTVVSNVLCGAALAGAPLRVGALLAAVVAGCLFYVGGMVLNDAFDADIDARERPERPIPSGRATRSAVFRLGFGLLFAALALLAAVAATGLSPAGAELLGAGAFTALAIVVYDRHHKGVAWSPLVMGLCRAGLYFVGALSVTAEPEPRLFVGALLLTLYVFGLTHVARFENASRVGRLWPALLVLLPLPWALVQGPREGLALAGALFAGWALYSLSLAARGGRNIGRAVVSLIAGISLLDVVLAGSTGAWGIAALAIAAWTVTLAGQRWVLGT